MSTSRSRAFQTQVFQRQKPFAYQSDLPPDVLPIKFKLRKSSAWCIPHDNMKDQVFQVVQLQAVTKKTIKVCPAMVLSPGSTMELIRDVLDSMLVPESEHLAIFVQIYPRIFEANNYSGNDGDKIGPLVVFINDVTLHMLPSASSIGGHQLPDDIACVTRQYMETYEAKRIENLEKVKFDDHLEECSSRSPQASTCAFCMEEFEAGGQESRLPCLHFDHGNCIVRWLKTSHLCPLCRYAMCPFN